LPSALADENVEKVIVGFSQISKISIIRIALAKVVRNFSDFCYSAKAYQLIQYGIRQLKQAAIHKRLFLKIIQRPKQLARRYAHWF
jgi:hypothetical protein